MEFGFTDLDGVRISYGEGPPNRPDLVFLHGFPAAWSEYAALLGLLTSHFRVLAPTMRGMGLSARSESYSWSAWIDDVGRFIGEVTDGPVLGVGHSAGAWLGLAAAKEDPGLFAAFVSLDQALDPQAHIKFYEDREWGMMAMVEAMRAATDVDDLKERLAAVPVSTGGAWGDHLSNEELASQADDLSAHDPEIFAAAVDDNPGAFIAVPELQSWPGAYRNPILFIDGDPESGSMVSQYAADYNRSRYPWAERNQIKGLDHSLDQFDNPEPIADMIKAYLIRVTKPRT